MENLELINIPAEMMELCKHIRLSFEGDICNMSDPGDAGYFTMVKVLSIATSIMVKNQTPLYLPDNANFSIIRRCSELADREYIDDLTIDELNEEGGDAQAELLDDYYLFCEALPSCLTSFGWKLMQSYNNRCGYRDSDIAPDVLLGSIERLSSYPDFMDGKKEKIGHSGYGIDIKIYIFTNKRLGKYMDYTLKHSVDTQLHTKIVETLSSIYDVWGIGNVTYSNKPDGYEVAYVLVSDSGYFPNDYNTAFTSDIDFLLPIYAANLEKLLDRAYALYPIEK